MKFSPPLIRGTLLKRYKRFLADLTLESGETVTAHCPNTGTMRSCSTPGSAACLSISDNPKRKYPFTLEMVMDNATWVGVNTSKTNKLVIEAIQMGKILEFQKIDTLKAEVKVSSHSRLDLLVTQGDIQTFIEIKNCSLAVDGCAMFPDAVTARGTKHLHELINLIEQGEKACIFFLVQRMDADHFTPASHIDPVYAKALIDAADAGVQILVYQAKVTPESIEVIKSLPFSLGA